MRAKVMGCLVIWGAILCIRPQPADALVIYEWVSDSFGVHDKAMYVNARWIMSDQEFNSGSFSTLNDDLGYLRIEVRDPSVPGRHEVFDLGNGRVLGSIVGTLSQDRRSISYLSLYEAPALGSAMLLDAMMDYGMMLSADRLFGMTFWSYYGQYYNWPFDDQFCVDQTGSWQMAAVPEPSTFAGVALGLSVVGAAAFRKRMKRRG